MSTSTVNIANECIETGINRSTGSLTNNKPMCYFSNK